MQNLNLLREKIDAIDAAIIAKLAEREEITKQIGVLKINQQLPVFDADREALLFKRYAQLCVEYQLAPDFVKALFELIHSHARELQQP